MGVEARNVTKSTCGCFTIYVPTTTLTWPCLELVGDYNVGAQLSQLIHIFCLLCKNYLTERSTPAIIPSTSEHESAFDIELSLGVAALRKRVTQPGRHD